MNRVFARHQAADGQPVYRSVLVLLENVAAGLPAKKLVNIVQGGQDGAEFGRGPGIQKFSQAVLGVGEVKIKPAACDQFLRLLSPLARDALMPIAETFKKVLGGHVVITEKFTISTLRHQMACSRSMDSVVINQQPPLVEKAWQQLVAGVDRLFRALTAGGR